MGLFRKAGRVAGKVAKNVILPEDEGAKKGRGKGRGKGGKAEVAKEPEAPAHTDAEYDELKEKYDAVMRAQWKEYYATSCDGECETCEYYDWCPEDYADEAEEGAEAADDGSDETAEGASGEAADRAEAAQARVSDEAAAGDGEGAQPQDGDAAAEADDEAAERELTPEELAAKGAAEAYYAAGCDGECETCEHYEWCPAEEEGDPDDKVLFKGVTQGDVKNMAKGSVSLARETALTVRDLKEALDDITGGLDVKGLLK